MDCFLAGMVVLVGWEFLVNISTSISKLAENLQLFIQREKHSLAHLNKCLRRMYIYKNYCVRGTVFAGAMGDSKIQTHGH